MHTHAHAQILFIHAYKQLMAQRCGNGFNLIDQRAGGVAQQYAFSTTVFKHRLALHQTLTFKAVEQAGQRRPFDANTLSQLALSGRFRKTGQVQQHQPTRLGQTQPRQAAVQFGAPTSGHLRQLHAKAVLIG